MGLPVVISVPLRLALLVFMIWVSIAISRVVTCATFTISEQGVASPKLLDSFAACHAGAGETPFLVMAPPRTA
jgi:hypothetical protein